MPILDWPADMQAVVWGGFVLSIIAGVLISIIRGKNKGRRK